MKHEFMQNSLHVFFVDMKKRGFVFLVKTNCNCFIQSSIVVDGFNLFSITEVPKTEYFPEFTDTNKKNPENSWRLSVALTDKNHRWETPAECLLVFQVPHYL